MDNPYREPGREASSPKLPRVVFERSGKRLVQTDETSFVIEHELEHTDAVGGRSKRWVMAWKLEPQPEPENYSRSVSRGLYQPSDDDRYRDHALWLAHRLAELS